MLGKRANRYVRDDVVLLGVVMINPADALSGGNDTYEYMDRSLMETGYLFSDPAEPGELNFGLRSVQPDGFDVDFARSCIAYCLDNHGMSCEKGTSEANSTRFLKVIDCETRKVIPAPQDCSYAALSYVWGSAPTPPNHDGIESGCPKVISHAIEVTLKLNFQYLWVDRYCIDQRDSRDKHNQIRQMEPEVGHTRKCFSQSVD